MYLRTTMNNIYMHPTAIVETEQIGEGTHIWAFTHVMNTVSIGRNCNIGEQCFIESGSAIGNDVTIKNGNMIWEGVTLEDGAFVGPNVSFTNDLYPRSPRLRQAHARYSNKGWLVTTLVKQGASVGAGAIILAGVVIGEFSMIGAGAVVTRDIPPYSLALGNPARISGWLCQCGQPLKWQTQLVTCGYCGLCLIKNGDSIQVADPGMALLPL
jgi:acetyltransferase-like isoleucine patch superfamily enzyme